MVYKRTKNVIGAVTIADIKEAIKGRDDDEIVYLDDFAFSVCVNDEGNLVFRQEDCKYNEKTLR